MYLPLHNRSAQTIIKTDNLSIIPCQTSIIILKVMRLYFMSNNCKLFQQLTKEQHELVCTG